MTSPSLFLGGAGPNSAEPQRLALGYANRHGLIAGATGTGKTVTLQIMAEGFSAAGTPVFMADVKGDLSGMAKAGSHAHPLHEKLIARAEKIGFDDYGYDAFPVVFWDLFGEQGHPIRATVTEMGPLLLSRLLGLNDTQEGVLNVVFALADEEGWLLLDFKDLRAILHYVGETAKEMSTRFGYVARASVGAIQRRLLALENEGGDAFFGEPALNIHDMIATTRDGRGRVNILAADRLMQAPRVYAAFLLWLLSELFETLPEVGDPDKPVMAFFFDEAHLLFDDAPKALLDKVETVARLIRSKGVGVYFVTQNPADVPDDVLGQLGNRVQHALRAYTPRDRKALRAAAQTFRPNPAFDAETAIPALGVGEGLVSTLERKGAPSMVQRTLIRPPSSQIGPITPEERQATLRDSPVAGQYDAPIDRHSAFEALQERAEAAAREAEADDEEFARGRRYDSRNRGEPLPRRSRRRGDTVAEAASKSFARSLSSTLGRELVRGVLGGLFGRRRRRR